MQAALQAAARAHGHARTSNGRRHRVAQAGSAIAGGPSAAWRMRRRGRRRSATRRLRAAWTWATTLAQHAGGVSQRSEAAKHSSRDQPPSPIHRHPITPCRRRAPAATISEARAPAVSTCVVVANLRAGYCRAGPDCRFSHAGPQNAPAPSPRGYPSGRGGRGRGGGYGYAPRSPGHGGPGYASHGSYGGGGGGGGGDAPAPRDEDYAAEGGRPAKRRHTDERDAGGAVASGYHHVGSSGGGTTRRTAYSGASDATHVYRAPEYSRTQEVFFAGRYGSGNWDVTLLATPRLRSVTFSPAFKVTDAHLQALTTLRDTVCSTLECVYAGDPADGLTDGGVEDLVHSCGSLRVLSLHGAFRLTDTAAIRAARELPRLELLAVTGFAQHGYPGAVTGALLRWLGEHPERAPRLRRLLLWDQPGVTEEAARQLSTDRRGLSIVLGEAERGAQARLVRTFVDGRVVAEDQIVEGRYEPKWGYASKWPLEEDVWGGSSSSATGGGNGGGATTSGDRGDRDRERDRGDRGDRDRGGDRGDREPRRSTKDHHRSADYQDAYMASVDDRGASPKDMVLADGRTGGGYSARRHSRSGASGVIPNSNSGGNGGNGGGHSSREAAAAAAAAEAAEDAAAAAAVAAVAARGDDPVEDDIQSDMMRRGGGGHDLADDHPGDAYAQSSWESRGEPRRSTRGVDRQSDRGLNGH